MRVWSAVAMLSAGAILDKKLACYRKQAINRAMQQSENNKRRTAVQ